MKKTLLCVFAVSMMAFGTSAKAQSFEEGMNVVSVGIGFPNIYKSIYDIYEFTLPADLDHSILSMNMLLPIKLD